MKNRNIAQYLPKSVRKIQKRISRKGIIAKGINSKDYIK